MAGAVEEKIKLIFNCFDEDGNGILSKSEFASAAKRFSTKTDGSGEAFAEKVFKACDADGDNKVTLQEFVKWYGSNPKDFDDFTGNINILKAD